MSCLLTVGWVNASRFPSDPAAPVIIVEIYLEVTSHYGAAIIMLFSLGVRLKRQGNEPAFYTEAAVVSFGGVSYRILTSIALKAGGSESMSSCPRC